MAEASAKIEERDARIKALEAEIAKLKQAAPAHSEIAS
jgi:hypothetical protein